MDTGGKIHIRAVLTFLIEIDSNILMKVLFIPCSGPMCQVVRQGIYVETTVWICMQCVSLKIVILLKNVRCKGLYVLSQIDARIESLFSRWVQHFIIACYGYGISDSLECSFLHARCAKNNSSSQSESLFLMIQMC